MSKEGTGAEHASGPPPAGGVPNPPGWVRRSVSGRPGRPGYVALDCGESGKRHTARKVTITSTEEEKLQRAFAKARRSAPPGLRGTGGGPR